MRVSADTWYFLALLNPHESGHAAAVDWSRRHLQVVTTEYVLLELGNALSPVAWRPRYVALERALRIQSATTMIATSAELFEAGLELFSRRLDKSWSLTDCISYAF